jgi:predicted O-linked N-acetylglucosamine transferase (SPINDLY family)
MNEILNKGLTLHKAGKLEDAKLIYEKLLIKDQNNFELINLLGVISLQQKNFNNAITKFNKAISINSKHHALYNNLGVTYKEMEQYDNAIKNFKRAIELNPNYAEAYNNLGIIFKKKYQYKEAFNNYKTAIELKDNYAEAYNNLGLLFGDIKNYKESIINFSKAIEINNNYIDAYKNRANIYSLDKQNSLAIKDYNKLKILEPDKENIYESLVFFNKNQICDWKDYKKNLRKIENYLTNNQVAVDYISPWKLLSCTDSLEIIKNNTNNYNDKEYKAKEDKKKLFSYTYPKKKIRIAYYSPDFRRHAVSHLIANVFENHNKDNFETIGFHFSKSRDDDMTKRISIAFDKFFDVKNISDQDVISQSKDLKIDVAIDLAGHTADNRTNIFVNRVAPIQINFLGHPGSAGPYMDYIVADKNLIPDKNQKFYFEKIIYMPDCYQPHDSKKNIGNSNYSRNKFNLPESNFLYCCFNSVYKINPLIFNSWMRILKKTKNTALCLLEGNDSYKENLLTEASKRGIGKNRIFFSARVDYEDVFQRFKLCDLFLDTFPYSAHTTANEALSSGLPLLAITGESFQSRVSASLLKNLNIPELITSNIDDYENFAISLANNPERLKEIREKLLSSIKSSNTFNAKIYTKNLEKAYQQTCDNYYKNLAPENIYIN